MNCFFLTCDLLAISKRKSADAGLQDSNIMNFALSCGKSSVLILSPYGSMKSFYDHHDGGYLSVVSRMALEATSLIK